MKNELTTLPVQGMSDLAQIGTQLETSGMFGLSREGSGLIVAMTCYQQNITPLDFLRTYHIIDNKPSMRADAMAAQFREAGGKYKVLKRDGKEAKAEFHFEGNKQAFSYTMKSAEDQTICYNKGTTTLKDTWKKYPENMLWARMMSNAVRVLCPEIVAGIYTPEEVADFDDASIKEEKVINPEVAEKALAGKTAEKKPETATEVIKKAEVTVDITSEEVKPETPKEPEAPKETPKDDAVDFSLCPLESEELGANYPFEKMKDDDINAIIECCMDNPKILQGHKDFVQKLSDARKTDKPKYE